MTEDVSSNIYRAVSVSKRGQGWRHAEKVFEAGEQNSPNAVTKEKATEIAANFMTTFYRVQVGALEAQEFLKGPMRQIGVHFPKRGEGSSK